MQSRNAPAPVSRKYLCFLSLTGDVPEPNRVWFFRPPGPLRSSSGGARRATRRRAGAARASGIPQRPLRANQRGAGGRGGLPGGRGRTMRAGGRGTTRRRAGGAATRRALPGGGATRRAAARGGATRRRATRRRRGGARWARAGLPIGGARGGRGAKKSPPRRAGAARAARVGYRGRWSGTSSQTTAYPALWACAKRR